MPTTPETNDVQHEEVDYSKCPYKHHVRVDGWLTPCLEQYKLVEKLKKKGARSRPLQYFTFCAADAIDVYLLRKEGVIHPDKNGTLHDVYFCEKDPESFEKIVSQFRTDTGGFLGELSDIILIDDPGTQTTLGDDLEEFGRVPNRAVREKQNLLEKQRRLKGVFPLDVINLDLCGHIFPPVEARSKKFERIISTIFDWQNSCFNEEAPIDSFVLLLTRHVELEHVDSEILGKLTKLSESNVKATDGYAEAFEKKFGTTDPAKVVDDRFADFFSVTLPKMIFNLASRYGWTGHYQKIYTYERNWKKSGALYYMMSFVIRFVRKTESPDPLQHIAEDPVYRDEVVKVLEEFPLNVTSLFHDDRRRRKEAETALAELVEFKKKVLDGLGL